MFFIACYLLHFIIFSVCVFLEKLLYWFHYFRYKMLLHTYFCEQVNLLYTEEGPCLCNLPQVTLPEKLLGVQRRSTTCKYSAREARYMACLPSFHYVCCTRHCQLCHFSFYCNYLGKVAYSKTDEFLAMHQDVRGGRGGVISLSKLYVASFCFILRLKSTTK